MKFLRGFGRAAQKYHRLVVCRVRLAGLRTIWLGDECGRTQPLKNYESWPAAAKKYTTHDEKERERDNPSGLVGVARRGAGLAPCAGTVLQWLGTCVFMALGFLRRAMRVGAKLLRPAPRRAAGSLSGLLLALGLLCRGLGVPSALGVPCARFFGVRGRLSCRLAAAVGILRVGGVLWGFGAFGF